MIYLYFKNIGITILRKSVSKTILGFIITLIILNHFM